MKEEVKSLAQPDLVDCYVGGGFWHKGESFYIPMCDPAGTSTLFVVAPILGHTLGFWRIVETIISLPKAK